MAPTPCSESKSMGRSRCSSVRHPPEGPPICTALKQSLVISPRASMTPPPISSTIWRERGAEGDFDQAGVGHVAGQGEGLGAGRALCVPRRRNSAAPWSQDQRHRGQGFDVVDHGGLAPQAALGRKGRLGPGHAAFAFDGGHQGRFLAADEGPGPFHHLDTEAGRGAEEIVAQQAQQLGVANRAADPPHGQRVLGPHVNVTFVGADRPGGDHHAFDHAMRIALHDAAIHEGPRIAFVAVADDVFLRAGLVGA